MRVHRYSRWDGSQEEFTLDAKSALDALSELLMEGLNVDEALEWMRQYGFELGGLDMRVMGLEELQDELRREMRSMEQRYNLDRSTDELAKRLDDILDREAQALRDKHGHESSRMNEFQSRRHGESGKLSDRIERMADHSFEDESAGDDFRELKEELDRLKKLEQFQQGRGQRFRGREAADYETAQQIRERMEQLEQLARDLAEGNFETLSPEQLRELLSENAMRSLVLIRDLERRLREGGYLRAGADGTELTPKAIRRIGASALASVYGALRKGRPGSHDTVQRGVALPRPDETRPFSFGDALDLDVVKTILNGVKRRAATGAAASSAVALSLDDFEIRECDFSTQTTTVLLLDMSWSMSWAGRFPAAKRVAIAMDHLIRTRYPRDSFHVVGFSTRARELKVRDLPLATWDMGDPFTNLQEGLQVAERLIEKHPSPSPQILVVTDGQPTAYFLGRELHVEWPMGFGGVSPHAVAETLKTVRRVTRRGITINTFMLDDAPELVGFVERMTEINRGRAFFTSPRQLGSFLMVDFVSRRRTTRR
jgi:uncharacterized protein with von Willebrand factor type A (vWA) domain